MFYKKLKTLYKKTLLLIILAALCMLRALVTFTNRQKHPKGRLGYYLRPLVLSTAFLHLTASRPRTEVPEIC